MDELSGDPHSEVSDEEPSSPEESLPTVDELDFMKLAGAIADDPDRFTEFIELTGPQPPD